MMMTNSFPQWQRMSNVSLLRGKTTVANILTSLVTDQMLTLMAQISQVFYTHMPTNKSDCNNINFYSASA